MTMTYSLFNNKKIPGPVARSVAMPLGVHAVPRLILASGTFFREDLVMKMLLRLLIQEEQLLSDGERMCAKYC